MWSIPNVIVCDGTMVGMRKDLLPFKHKNQPQEPVIKGSRHVERVLILKLLQSDGFLSLAQLLDKFEKKYHERTAQEIFF